MAPLKEVVRNPSPERVAHPLLRALEERVTERFLAMEQDPYWIRFLDGTMTREEYAWFLVQTYHYVMITPSTYEWALSTMRREPKAHYGPFLAEFEEHWQEELGHEHWLLEDLTALGYDAKTLVMRVPPCPSVSAYIALSKAFTAGPTPLALLGQDYFLESLALRFGERIVRGLLGGRIPGVEKAIKFITGHGEADIKHMELNRQSLLRVSDPEECRAILATAETTGWLYATMAHHFAAAAPSFRTE